MSRKDKVLNSLSLTQVLSYYNVKKGKGKDSYYCPFHDDKKPSLVAGDQKGVATCLSQECIKGVDIFLYKLCKQNIKNI